MRKEEFSKRLRQLHKQRGWDQERLSRNGYVARNTLQNAFLGNGTPNLTTVQEICDGLHITLGQFFTDEETTKTNVDYVITDPTEEIIELIESAEGLSKTDLQPFINYFNYIKMLRKK